MTSPTTTWSDQCPMNDIIRTVNTPVGNTYRRMTYPVTVALHREVSEKWCWLARRWNSSLQAAKCSSLITASSHGPWILLQRKIKGEFNLKSHYYSHTVFLYKMYTQGCVPHKSRNWNLEWGTLIKFEKDIILSRKWSLLSWILMVIRLSIVSC